MRTVDYNTLYDCGPWGKLNVIEFLDKLSDALDASAGTLNEIFDKDRDINKIVRAGANIQLFRDLFTLLEINRGNLESIYTGILYLNFMYDYLEDDDAAQVEGFYLIPSKVNRVYFDSDLHSEAQKSRENSLPNINLQNIDNRNAQNRVINFNLWGGDLTTLDNTIKFSGIIKHPLLSLRANNIIYEGATLDSNNMNVDNCVFRNFIVSEKCTEILNFCQLTRSKIFSYEGHLVIPKHEINCTVQDAKALLKYKLSKM